MAVWEFKRPWGNKKAANGYSIGRGEKEGERGYWNVEVRGKSSIESAQLISGLIFGSIYLVCYPFRYWNEE